jgi:putative nucleotidyltransferase with HDIG domain
VAALFCVATILVLMLRENVVPHRPGEYTPTDITARVGFVFADKDKLADLQQRKRDMEPRVYSPNGDVYRILQDLLVNLPQKVAKLQPDELPPNLKGVLDSAALGKLQEYASRPHDEESYIATVKAYVDEIKQLDPIVLQEDQRHEELKIDRLRMITIQGRATPVSVEQTNSNQHLEMLESALYAKAKKDFVPVIAPVALSLTIDTLKNNPTHTLNPQATTAAQELAVQKVTHGDAEVFYSPKDTIVPKGEISAKGWQLLKAENTAFLHEDFNVWKMRGGTAAAVIMLTVVLAGYIAKFQPRVVRNHARAIAIGALLISMLVLAQIAGLGSSPTYVFGIAPTIVVAMIMTIAYDQRFAAGIGAFHAALVTMALNESIGFFLVVLAGVLTCCFLLDDIRTRSKLIEVGGAAACALILASCAASLLELIPPQYVYRNALYAGAAGLGVGFVVLGILPFIEKAFGITTSMTLLELADNSQPLLRRLALEAPGTYNHSQQVATLSEEAAEAIGANSLACRVGSYYHDIGKINKADYFIENQVPGHNRHINLSPSVSLLIIIGHVKDGVEMAKEYNLPRSLLPFIQQHHGTTLVEFFYHRACDTCTPDQPTVSEVQYRYPGPKPKSKEIAIVMLSDAVESATRAMAEPTASRIEALVHDLAMKRLLDGQFDECDLTMRELELIERSLARTLQGIYHGRIAYPSTQTISTAPTDQAPAAKSA